MAIQISESAVEPVALAEVRDYLRLETEDEDGLLSMLITACRQDLERWLKRALVSQVWRDYAPDLSTPVYAPMLPLTSATVATLADDVYTDVDTSLYAVNVALGRVSPLVRIEPETDHPDGVQITYTTTITTQDKRIRLALLELIAYRYQNRGNLESAAIPASVQAMVSSLRVYSV